MPNLAALTSATQSLALLKTPSASPSAPMTNAKPVVMQPLRLSQVMSDAAARVAAAQVQAAGTAVATIELSASGGAYETYGSKTVTVGTSGPNSANQTVTLKAGATYTISTAFGLSDSRGQMKIELLDASNKVVTSTLAGVGKTQNTLTMTAATAGIYTIRLTGQPIGKTGTSTNLYGSYQIGVGQALSKLPTTSGDKNIDALLMGGTNVWHHATGSVATKTTNVIKTGVTELQNVVGRSIKFAFMDSSFLSQLTGSDATGAAVMSATQKQAVQDVFAYYSSIINQSFELVTDPKQADIVFGTNNQGGTSAGYAYMPNRSGSHAQYLMLANDQSTNSNFSNGSYGLLTLVHEIGHTLGLKHPGNSNAGGGGTPGPYLAQADDNRRNTVMSYYSASGISANPQTLMAYDMAALQYLYGANRTPSNAQALAKYQTTTFTDGWAGLESLWTPQGGTVDLTAMTKNNLVDLREGAFSSIGTTKNNVSLAYGSKISTVKGGSGADQVYTAASGTMTLDGGAGNDTLYLSGTAKEWTLNGSTYTRKVGGKTVATVAATGFETIAYYDPTKAALMHA